ncbi:MAG TPA: methyl-accepting chemotaxis protein [Xanthobacteraceae bacterium]|nr:methyl-accepting chemotaxis protein [Xanthobacteraceae bacterium]
MDRLKIRIGTKLGASTLIGLILVVGMVGNQARVNQITRSMIEAVTKSRDLQQSAIEAKVILSELNYIDRDIRLADSAPEVAQILQHLQNRTRDANFAFEGALAVATHETDRQLLATAKESFNSYVQTVTEIGSIQLQIIELRNQRMAENAAWFKAVDALLNSREISVANNRYALESNIQQANAELMRAGTISGRFEDAELRQILTGLDVAAVLLEEVRHMARDPALAAAIDDLRKFPSRSRDIAEKLARSVQTQESLLREQAVLRRAMANDSLDLMTIRADQNADELTVAVVQEERRGAWVNFAVGALVILVMFAVTLFSSVMIGRPIRRIAEVLMALARGESAGQIPYQDRRDEVGDAARAASIFRSNIQRVRELEAEQQRALEQAAALRKQQTRQLADEFEQAVGAVVTAVSRATRELQGTAKSLAETAEQTHRLANSASVAASEASCNVRSVAAASDQLAVAIAEIGQQAQHSREIAGQAVRGAALTDARITQMSQVVERIGNVVKLITDIAEQTNLLALNATIEAARAGDAGRGFAVVAAEVKHLANQTAKATEEIAAQIADVQAVTKDAVSAIKEIGGIIHRVSEIATSITAAVEEQHAATQAIALNVQEAAQGTDSVSNRIKTLEADASATGAVAHQVFSFASQLATEGNILKLQAEKFLETVRAA